MIIVFPICETKMFIEQLFKIIANDSQINDMGKAKIVQIEVLQVQAERNFHRKVGTESVF